MASAHRMRSWLLLCLIAAAAGARAPWRSGAVPWRNRGVDPPTFPPAPSVAPVSPSAASYTGIKNVLDYGATGDGRTDDTDAIQAALNALRPGETCLFPPGVYVAARLLVPETAGVTLRGIAGGASEGGSGAGATLRLANGTAGGALPPFLLASAVWAANRTWTGAPVTLEHLCFEGPGAAAPGNGATNGSIGVVLMAWSTRVARCVFRGFGRAGLLVAGADRAGKAITTTEVNCRYEANVFSGNAGVGFWIFDPDRNKATDYFLLDSFAFSNGLDGFRLDTTAGAVVRGNHLYSNGMANLAGFDVHVGIGSKAFRFLGNYLEGPRGLKIATLNPDATVQVADNYFEGIAVYVANDGNGTVLSTGNVFGAAPFPGDGGCGGGAAAECMHLAGYRGHRLTLRTANDAYDGSYRTDGDVAVFAASMQRVG